MCKIMQSNYCLVQICLYVFPIYNILHYQIYQYVISFHFFAYIYTKQNNNFIFKTTKKQNKKYI